MSADDDKRTQSINFIETYAYRISKDIIYKNEETKCNNMIKEYKKWLTLTILHVKNIKEQNSKLNALLNIINPQPDIDKIYLCAKALYELKYQLLINKRKSVGITHCNDSTAFIEYSNDMQGFP